MRMDHSPHSGHDLYRPFHLHPALCLLQTSRSPLGCLLSATAAPRAALRDTAGEQGGKLGPQPLVAQEGNRKHFVHRDSFLEDLGMEDRPTP